MTRNPEPPGKPEAMPARTNALGNPCPGWCTIEHVTQARTINLHMGDPIGHKPLWEAKVRLMQDDSDRYLREQPLVAVRKSASGVQLDHAQAEGLADLLEALVDDCTPDQLRALAIEVRAAASTIDPMRQLSATVAKITVDREAE
jgi:hypothetical protein